MMRTFILGALAATAIGFAAPAQAGMANPGLGAAAPVNVEHAQFYGGGYYYGPRRGYYGHRYYGHRRGYYRNYAFAPRCWTQRIVRWDGRVRYIRRCR